MSGTRRMGREGGSSWNSYVARRKVVGNEVIIFSGKSRQLDRRGRDRESVSRHRESWREKRVWWTNIRSFDGAVGRSPWITNEFVPRLLPAAFFRRVDVSARLYFREKTRAKLFVLSLGGRLSAERNVWHTGGHHLAINKSEKVRGVRFKDRIRQIDTWIFQNTCYRADDGKFSLYKALSFWR